MDSETEKINMLLKKADRARQEDQPNGAKAHILSALQDARRQADPVLISRSLNQLARVERDLGNISYAIKNYNELLAHSRTNSDTAGIAHALQHLGDIYREENQFDQAESYLRKALSIYEGDVQNSKLERANGLRSLALLKSTVKNRAEARLLWEKARNLYQECGISEGVEECNSKLNKNPDS